MSSEVCYTVNQLLINRVICHFCPQGTGHKRSHDYTQQHWPIKHNPAVSLEYRDRNILWTVLLAGQSIVWPSVWLISPSKAKYIYSLSKEGKSHKVNVQTSKSMFPISSSHLLGLRYDPWTLSQTYITKLYVLPSNKYAMIDKNKPPIHKWEERKYTDVISLHQFWNSKGKIHEKTLYLLWSISLN